MENTEGIAKESFGLDDLTPAEAEITLNGKVYQLRKSNLRDEAWLKQYGDLQKRFDAEDFEFMARFCFRLLKDQTDFLPIQRDEADDEGKLVPRSVPGWARVMEGISGPRGKYDLIQALMQTIGVSRPMFESMVEDSLKKKMNPTVPQTGDSSST